MKFTKKNILAICGAVTMTACLATAASASNLPGPLTSAGGAYVVAADVDVSTLDFSEALESTPIAVGTIDPQDYPCGLTTASSPAECGIASVVAGENAETDLSGMDFTEMLAGTPIPVGTIDPSSVSGTSFTQGK